MAQAWAQTTWKRLVLAGLNAFASVPQLFFGRRPDPNEDRSSIRRILVVELWNIGDVVLTMPFLSQLRILFPDAKTTLLAPAHAREVLLGTGLVDEIIEVDLTSRKTWLTRNPFAYDWRRLWRLHRQLQQRDFDIAFKCRPHIREQIILALSGARRRVGYPLGSNDRLLTDAIFVADLYGHKLDDWLHLLRPFGGPVDAPTPMLHLTEAERQAASGFLSSRGVSPGEVVIGIHPGASSAYKRWPLERFQEVAADLANRDGFRVIAFIDPEGHGEPLGKIAGVITARVALRELMALVAKCDLLVCNDSGPMHLAGALGVPTVAVFRSGVDRMFSPLGAGHELVISSTWNLSRDGGDRAARRAQLTRIPASQVLEAIERVLRKQTRIGNSSPV